MAKKLVVGKQALSIRHFTTDITNFPFIMDANCYIVFSHLWRKYISSSINDHLITDDGWFQYTMKSLAQHCGFSDIGTLHRAVEGLYRAYIIDVRAESGSRLWACWKLNKEVIERLSSLSIGDVMAEPYLNSINAIESKDKTFTYRDNLSGIDELQQFFGIEINRNKTSKPSENPPLLNTITLQYNNTIKPYNHKTIKQQNNNTTKQEPHKDSKTIEMQSQEQTIFDKNFEEELEKELVSPLDNEESENLNELKSKIEANENSVSFQPQENHSSEEMEDVHQTILDTYYEKFKSEPSSLIPNTLKVLAAKHPSTFKWLIKRMREPHNRPLYYDNLQLIKKLVEQYQLDSFFFTQK